VSESLGTAVSEETNVSAPDDRYVRSIRRIITGREKPKDSEEKVSHYHFFYYRPNKNKPRPEPDAPRRMT
jgi:hypothetical protein